jgi:uncharacterized protein YcbX
VTRCHLERINVTPVKGLGLQHPPVVELTRAGVESNRRFYLTSAGRMYNGKDHGPLVSVRALFEQGRLTLTFPGGEELVGEVALAERVETDFWGRTVTGRVVLGPWSEALSAYAGVAIRLVQTERPGTGTDIAVGTMLGRGSWERLGTELGTAIDPRRFRMLLELGGLAAHAEDEWRGRRVRIGEAVVVGGGPVPRCAVTTQDPDTGRVSLDTLRAIRAYRGLRDGRWIDFGVYFEVAEPGRVHVGDAVVPL